MSDPTPLDIRTAQTTIEDVLRDAILCALGKRIAAVATVADLRDVVTQAASGTERSDDDLAAVGAGGATVGYRWSTTSNDADNGASVIKPNDVTGQGRWLQWTSPLRFSSTVGGDSMTLDQITSGPVNSVTVIDKRMSPKEMTDLFEDTVPAVVIVALEDNPEEVQPGMRWNWSFDFEIAVIVENFRSRREAAQGSSVDSTLGGNDVDGFVMALLNGTQLSALGLAIFDVKLGGGSNNESEFGERRVFRSRTYSLLVTEYFPNAPNEIGRAEEIDFQPKLSSLDEAKDAFDPQNYRVSGMTVAWPTTGLSQDVTAGLANIAGVPVTYAGEAAHAFPPWAEVFRDLNPDGTMTFTAIDPGMEEPPLAVGSLRIGKTRTNGVDIVDDVILAATSTDYGPPFVVPLD